MITGDEYLEHSFPPTRYRGRLIPGSLFEAHHLNVIWRAAQTDPEAAKWFRVRGLPVPKPKPRRQPGESDKSDAREPTK
jgi:hypothetical protein